ncbi:hypothetical protein F7Q99_19360 [Streptomyces kaniharaensis]|uniref:Lipoprotein n=1 Tax=Streptomyces kaniharaensis TaxID=212423 RepID=A0A6N7KWI4_9ACTN|nr:hypothetical protein [Streptomyces kaniharaensis]MQS14364.1 hypothetical protein [Streptomyces kaniharaensis]
MFRWIRVGGLVLAVVLAGAAAGCSGGPSDGELRAEATSPQAESARAAKETEIRSQIASLGEVEGLEPVLTRFSDSCAEPSHDELYNRDSPALSCGMEATAYFGVQGDITAVLPRIGAVDLVARGTRNEDGNRPFAADDAVRYALEFHRNRGRYPDGWPMPGPELRTDGFRIDWDRPDAMLVNQIKEPDPCRAQNTGGIYRRCEVAPKGSATVAEARARYGTVLAFSVRERKYFTVEGKD